MAEGENIIPEEYAHEKADVIYDNPEEGTQEIKDELREVENKEGTEFELAPEIAAKIMDKVIDLQRGDFFVHQTKSENISELLSSGLFSPKFADRIIRMGKETNFPREKIKEIKELPGGPLKIDSGGNLVGLGKSWWEYSGDLIWLTDGKYYNNRNGHHDDSDYWFRATSSFGNTMIVLDKQLEEKQTGRGSGHTFAIRISPKWFIGLIVTPESYDEVLKTNYQNGKLPIYDANDNLLWPRQMSYEEVKQFVAERELKKQVEKNQEHGNPKL